MIFTGTFRRSLDQKHRLAIPKQLRNASSNEGENGLFITTGNDQSLALFTEQNLQHFADQLAESSPTTRDVRDFKRLFYARAHRCDLDRQGRIRIPEELSELANLSAQSEIVLLGVYDHLELWNSARWETYLSQKQAQFDQIAESAFERKSS